jgi:hypothetical protein
LLGFARQFIPLLILVGMDPDHLVFNDESSAKTNLTRLRGRAPRGQMVKAHALYGRW